MPAGAAVRGNCGGIVGGIHDVVQICDPLSGHGHQRNRHLTVVHRRRGQQATNWYLPVRHVDVEFVSGPTRLVALAVLLGSDIAHGGKLCQHGVEVLRDLPLQAGGFLRPLFALFGRPLGRGGSAGGGGSAFLAGFSRASISVASRATQPTIRAPMLRAISAACMRSASSVTANSSKLVPAKAGGTRERGLARDLPALFPATYTTKHAIRGEAVDQCDGGRQAEHGFCHERPRQGTPIFRLAATPAAWRRRHEGLQADRIEHMDQPFQRFGKRVEFLPHPGEQSRLDTVPPGDRAVMRFRHHASNASPQDPSTAPIRAM